MKPQRKREYDFSRAMWDKKVRELINQLEFEKWKEIDSKEMDKMASIILTEKMYKKCIELVNKEFRKYSTSSRYVSMSLIRSLAYRAINEKLKEYYGLTLEEALELKYKYRKTKSLALATILIHNGWIEKTFEKLIEKGKVKL